VPRQDRAGFLALNRLFDVLLDPVHFGGGNTTYEAVAMGVPTVTLPSKFLRGRITYGIYRSIGVSDCLAASTSAFVDLAHRIANDEGFRRDVRAKLAAAADLLYKNRAGVRDLEAFLESATERARLER
jgi:predicted O-linked N-acetylglucosamine transferase (SPINDLY family)